MAHNDKNICLPHSIYQEHVILIYGTCVYYFFKILIFCVVRMGVGDGGGVGVKGQKIVQNVKKFCLSHSISQELYTI